MTPPHGAGVHGSSGPPGRPTARRSVRVAAVVAAVLGLFTLAGFVVLASDGRRAEPPKTFAQADAFTTPVVADPQLDPDGARLTRLLADRGAPLSLNVGSFGQPVYVAEADTPRHDLVVRRAGGGSDEWGRNALSEQEVPIPDDAVPSSGSDGKLVVVDAEARRVYDLWRAERIDGQWYADWGGVYPLDGDGSSDRAAYGPASRPGAVARGEVLSRGTGSGVSSLAGLLRIDELVSGRVDHALVFVTDKACGPPQEGPYRYPATSTDGTVTDGPCLPQGARVRLDPELDLDELDLTPVERTVATALQDFGAYAVDNGGVRFGIITESPRTDGQRSSLAALGVTGDNHYLDGIPTDRFHVLASWDGS